MKPLAKTQVPQAFSVAQGSPLWAALAEVEAAHFRTAEDTGANPCALLVWNALRRRLGLPWISKDQLPAWDGNAYAMPPDSTLLANVQSEPRPRGRSHTTI